MQNAMVASRQVADAIKKYNRIEDTLRYEQQKQIAKNKMYESKIIYVE